MIHHLVFVLVFRTKVLDTNIFGQCRPQRSSTNIPSLSVAFVHFTRRPLTHRLSFRVQDISLHPRMIQGRLHVPTITFQKTNFLDIKKFTTVNLNFTILRRLVRFVQTFGRLYFVSNTGDMTLYVTQKIRNVVDKSELIILDVRTLGTKRKVAYEGHMFIVWSRKKKVSAWWIT